MNVFDLFAKISLDTRDYEKNLGDAKSKFSGFADGLKSAVGKVGKILTGIGKAAAAGVTAASTALTALTKQTLAAVGDFEQLEGGAKKIFDEMDFEKISRDAQNAYKELNMSASEYLESINLAGATFAQTMGDEKGYDTARKGMLAIADYASGTGRNLEELNQKYQMITRATSSYQSIADQFSGILPATSADFLEQAQAAGYLADTYEKLTEVPVAEYQQALTNMLERGVENLGLSNNTLRESTETLTGSFAMAKAAWQNFLTGQGTTKDFTGALTSAIENTKKNLKTIIPRLTTGLTELMDLLAPEIPALVEDTLPAIITGASSLLSGLAERLPQLITTIAPSLVDGVLKVSTALIKIAPQIGKTILDLAGKGVDYLTSNMSVIIEKVLSISGKILKKLTDPQNITAVVTTATNIAKTFADALFSGDMLNRVLAAAPVILENLVTGITQSLPILVDGAEAIITSIVEWFSNGDNLLDLLQAAISILTALGKGMWDCLSIITGEVGKIAEKIADAFGIGDYWRAGKKSIEDFKDGVAAAYEECKEFFEGVGEKIFEDLHPELRQNQLQDMITQSLVEQNAPQNVIAHQRGATGEPTYIIQPKENKIPHNIAEEYEMRYRHAKGFYANRPTVLTGDIVGEAGDEVLLPLDSNTGWMDKLAEKLGGRIGGGIVIESLVINASGGNGAEIADSFIARTDELLSDRHVMQSRGIGATGW
jgi:hypothetical protein